MSDAAQALKDSLERPFSDHILERYSLRLEQGVPTLIIRAFSIH
jgi:hypothetical protein